MSKVTADTVLLKVRRKNIPSELKTVPQWVVWQLEPKKDKPDEYTKVPYIAQLGSKVKASSTNASTWRTFDEAFAVYKATDMDGIGFVLTDEDDFVGVDIDNCRDPETGEITTLAQTIIQNLDSYSEVSPSGQGVRVILRGNLPPSGRKNSKEDVEMYESGRYLTITGHRLEVIS
jgi:putative DNA primase/helicase